MTSTTEANALLVLGVLVSSYLIRILHALHPAVVGEQQPSVNFATETSVNLQQVDILDGPSGPQGMLVATIQQKCH